jgi:hypothetical protein
MNPIKHATWHSLSFTLRKTGCLCGLLFALIFQTNSVHAVSLPTIATHENNQAWSFATPLGIDPWNISGIVLTADFMALATDEGHEIQLFKPLKTKLGQRAWESHQVIALDESMAALSTELDIEGLAWQAPYLYAMGSHSVKRDKLKAKNSHKQNLIRLQTVSREPARRQLFSIELDGQYNVIAIASLSLTQALQNHAILGLFTGIPSKENGIDIEGLAVDAKGRLLVGFRGPVLRGNIATVLRLKLHKKSFKIKSVKTRYLPLAGRGIRGISEMSGRSETASEFLVLSGAVGDQDLSYQIYSWDGENNLPSKSVANNSLHYLCDLPASLGKPEGIQFLQKTKRHIEFVIVQDGLKNGQPTVFSCPLYLQ